MNSPVVPGNRPLTPQQKDGLAWVGRWGGRDVVLAIDLTESVGLNDPGRLHLRQIIEKTLTKGDTVHILPFAMTVRSPVVFEYQGSGDIPKILEAMPMNAGTEQGTDIMCAEHFIYRYLAQLNQDRLYNQQPIKNQSVIWLTDAPLNLPQGQAHQWKEVPKSRCGLVNTPEASQRSQWLAALPMQQRSIQPGQFQLTVVDVPATVQEFCTPKPGGGEVCLVNAYLWGQLWWQILLAGVLGILGLGGGLGFAVHWLRQQIPWSVTVQVGDQEYHFSLKHGQKIGVGGNVTGTFLMVPLPSMVAIATLERRNQNLIIHALEGDLTCDGQPIFGSITIPKQRSFVLLAYKDEIIRIIL
ncbi:VWA domain-containing protein [Thermosynechococcus sp.]|uniref:VWA domain-containing protein n=1 Tax=Thermosynechococcus sp. TaxID=2814275 RepID=UPI00391A7F54